MRSSACSGPSSLAGMERVRRYSGLVAVAHELVVSLLAMEPPVTMAPDALRDQVRWGERDACPFGKSRAAKACDHSSEELGRNGEVVDRKLRMAISAVDICQQCCILSTGGQR